MDLINRVKLCIVLFVITFSTINANDIKDQSEEFIRRYFGDGVKISFYTHKIDPEAKRKIEIECGQRFFKNEVIIWEVYDGEVLRALALLDNVYGKSLPITFMAIFDLAGNILETGIVAYREPFGGGVTNESWQNQFIGKNKSSKVKIGEDIQAISGATISANSVTRGIKKLTLLIEELTKKYAEKTLSTR